MPWDTSFGSDAFAEDDDTPPVIVDISPVPDSLITPRQPVSFRLSDETGLFECEVTVSQDGTSERVWDGEVFCGPYRLLSTCVPTAGAEDRSLDFVVARSGGWYASPSFRVVALDTGENEATG